MEEIYGISVMMAVGEDVTGSEANYQVSLISNNGTLNHSFIPSTSSANLSSIQSSSLPPLNGIPSYDENDQTDDEVDAINKQSELTGSNSTEYDESAVIPESEQSFQFIQEAEKTSSILDDNFALPITNSSYSSPQIDDIHSNSTPESSGNSDINDDVSLPDICKEELDTPKKNEAEHMLLAVRDLNTPWAKELEKRLVQEIKEGDQKKRDQTDKPRNKSRNREHENLMKAMKEIGTGWAQDIEKANYLKSRSREKVNYKVGLRCKTAEELKKNPVTDDKNQQKPTKRILPDTKMHVIPNGNQVVKKMKPNVKSNQSAARLLLQKAVTASHKKQIGVSKTSLGSKKIVDNKMKFKTKVKPNKVEKVPRNTNLHQSNVRINCMSSTNESENALSPIMMTDPSPSTDKSVKHAKINNYVENSFKNIEKVKACISNFTPITKKRYSARQQEQSSMYKEIGVKKHTNFIQIIFLNKQNAAFLGIQALKELKSVFMLAKHDPMCKLIFMNGSGRVFCSGVDLTLICLKDNQKIAIELSLALREFLKVLLSFPKPIVAGVNGSATGLGVTILPMCDLIYASDKATFSAPYTKLSQVPEGGASFSFPHILGPAIASDMLLGGRVLTAQEACQYGLVSQVIWPSQFMETLFPKVEKLASESSQGMEATKQLMKACFKSQLEAHVDKECCLLKEQWSSQACQKSIQTVIQNRLLHA